MVRLEVYGEVSASIEENQKIAEDMSLKGKCRKEMGLKGFEGVKIRYVVIGDDVTISQKIISKLLGVLYMGYALRFIQ